mmetsp:Transcript_6624/g.13420  ORF Transcript_6624/g.13420 Transcript_6624/m.13420 type:complete len:93 (-) Transcript_6624:146-424(-)
MSRLKSVWAMELLEVGLGFASLSVLASLKGTRLVVVNFRLGLTFHDFKIQVYSLLLLRAPHVRKTGTTAEVMFIFTKVETQSFVSKKIHTLV